MCEEAEKIQSKLLINHVLHSQARKAQLRSRSHITEASSFLVKGEKNICTEFFAAEDKMATFSILKAQPQNHLLQLIMALFPLKLPGRV